MKDHTQLAQGSQKKCGIGCTARTKRELQGLFGTILRYFEDRTAKLAAAEARGWEAAARGKEAEARVVVAVVVLQALMR